MRRRSRVSLTAAHRMRCTATPTISKGDMAQEAMAAIFGATQIDTNATAGRMQGFGGTAGGGGRQYRAAALCGGAGFAGGACPAEAALVRTARSKSVRRERAGETGAYSTAGCRADGDFMPKKEESRMGSIASSMASGMASGLSRLTVRQWRLGTGASRAPPAVSIRPSRGSTPPVA